MKKRAFLLPLATAVAALTTGASADAKTVVPASGLTPSVSDTANATGQLPQNLVIDRAEGQVAQYGHSSHGSHGSHASHASHTSSR